MFQGDQESINPILTPLNESCKEINLDIQQVRSSSVRGETMQWPFKQSKDFH